MKKLLVILLLAGFGGVACSPDSGEEKKAASTSANKVAPAAAVVSEDDAEIRKRISAELEGISPEDLSPSPIAGLYEVVKGSAIGYVSTDGRYLIEGDLLDLKTETNLSEARRNAWRQQKLASIDEDKMIIFAPKKYDHTVTIFTDVDCGYCRKLHSQIAEYLAEGIRVRYVFYPLRGTKAASYQKAEAVWCSKDQQAAMTRAKQGKEVKAEACETPVAMHLETGMELGIRGTPGIITESGELLPGYMPPETLKAALEPEPVVEEKADVSDKAKAG